MELKMERNDWMFFLLCLIVAIVAEETSLCTRLVSLILFLLLSFICYFSGDFDLFLLHIKDLVIFY